MSADWATAPQHLFSVDVEEYFQVSAFENAIDPVSWDHLPSRVERSIDQLLELLDRHHYVGTFFTVGWLTRSHGAMIRRIAEAGHEIGSHSYWHRRVTSQDSDEFREEVRSSRAALEDATGRAIHGFRAPSFSIRPGGEWAFDVLLEEGYRYDSSLFPIRRPDYGYPGAPARPHLIQRPAGTLLEVPMATTRFAGIRLPAAGGGYLRQLPLRLIRRAFREHGAAQIPGMFYIHPWEIDPDQPRLPVSWLTRVRHYRGLHRTLPRLEQLCREFQFTSVERRFGLSSPASGRPAHSWDPQSIPLPAWQ